MKRLGNFILYMIIMLGLLSSCNNHKPDDKAYSIEAALKNCKEVLLSKYASDIEYIPLGTNSESAIDYIENIFSDNDYVYIFCKLDPQRVMIFDKQGNFISKIEKNGRGPEEYRGIQDLILEEHNNETHISLLTDPKIVSYRRDGEFVRKTDLNIPLKRHSVSSFAYLNNGKYALLCSSFERGQDMQIKNRRRKLIVVDTVGQVLYDKDLAVSIPTHSGRYNRSSYLYSYNGNLRLNTGMESKDTLFLFNNNLDTLSYYVFDFGNLRSDINEKGAQIWHRATIENDRFIKFLVYAPWEVMTTNFPKKASKTYLCAMYLDKESDDLFVVPYNYEYSSQGFVNDLDEGGMPFEPWHVSGNKMYQTLPAATFMEYAEISSSTRMKEVAATITEESNPVLIVATLK